MASMFSKFSEVMLTYYQEAKIKEIIYFISIFYSWAKCLGYALEITKPSLCILIDVINM